MHINTRIDRLEKVAQINVPSPECAVCGNPVDLKQPTRNRLRIGFEGDFDPIDDFCKGCGRQQVYRMPAPDVKARHL